jgi:hypothetical protein
MRDQEKVIFKNSKQTKTKRSEKKYESSLKASLGSVDGSCLVSLI